MLLLKVAFELSCLQYMEADKACDNVSRLLSKCLNKLIVVPIAFVS